MHKKPTVIEHDPNEPDHDPRKAPAWVWWAAFGVLALLWTDQLLTDATNWTDVMIGIATGAIILAWAADITGNKTPEWLRTPRRNRDL